ncbi:MAG: hypothetical protein UT37_C0005G0002 [Parcubacteria group bacterium GW2011_GWA2_39_18]|nr:MAG: hypothetical protein UT37_C0005G0002 [Parcubacteria group bacterium GW2011_GWA2_39_18]
MHFVYLLFNTQTGKFYIGETNNIKRRFIEHCSGKNISTKNQHDFWKLVYVEIYKSKKDALIREKKLKSHGSGLVELRKRLKFSLEELNPKLGLGKGEK